MIATEKNHPLRIGNHQREQDVHQPVFDREIELSRASARLVARNIGVLLVEGNYLLAKTAPWSDLEKYFDLTAMIACPEQTLRARLMKRWRDLDFDEASATKKVEGNDLPNARFVIEQSGEAQFSLS